MSELSETSVFAPLDVAQLMGQGLAGFPDLSGKRKVHKRRLNRSSDEEHSHLPLDVSLQSQSADDIFASIPDQLISHASIEYVGFSKAKADEIWNSWNNWPSTGPRRETDPSDGGLVVTFLDFISGHIATSFDTSEDDDGEWTNCMNRYGLATELQHAILDPHFKYLRLSKSCADWSRDTIHMRYAGLKEIQRASWDRAMTLQRAGYRLAARSDNGSSARVEPPSGSTSSRPGQRSISGMQRDMAPGISTESSNSASAIAARNAPGHVVLFKAMDQGRIRGLLDENGRLKQIETLLSSPPSDFSGTRSRFYFTPDFKVAQYYAAYAKRRANVEAVVMIRIAIPNHVIEGMEEGEIQRLYWPSPEWKEFVWCNRTARALPRPLRKLRAATLMIGTIARKPNECYHQLRSWEAMSESWTLKLGGQDGVSTGIQYVFSGEEEGQELLTEHVSENIKVYPFPASELDEWMEEHEESFSSE
ncbi:hypothetical protein CDV31_001151 [Fusarium ambrosium]|uniref:Uncharacterized protein n=1 Tax=Fusarium ambrosium TaxID=131363 RepID=A0A428V0N0_9HYPO|nr:hypothetical protein CDV31_001151 [Fusarium ambrosium]